MERGKNNPRNRIKHYLAQMKKEIEVPKGKKSSDEALLLAKQMTTKKVGLSTSEGFKPQIKSP